MAKKMKTVSLSGFKKYNPEAIVTVDKDNFIINKPWGDNTISLVFSKANTNILSELNKIILTRPFSAIYHTDTKKLEFIYTIFSSGNENDKFKFSLNGKKYECEFNKSTKELLDIASAFKRKDAKSSTNYRNLDEFEFFFFEKKLIKDKKISTPKKRVPMSFFISGINWDKSKTKESEIEMIEIANHLNFYLNYFDNKTPNIIIHEEEGETHQNKGNRYLFGEFPKEIKAHKLDPYLLILHNRAKSEQNNFLKYLYFYQIIEYASFYYLKDDLAQQLTSVLLSPYTEGYMKTATQKIIDIMSEDSMHVTQKFNSVIKKFAEPEIIWKVIESLKKDFSSDIIFDGNLTIKKIVKEESTIDDFKISWDTIISTNLRNIRNSISHSGEDCMTSNILPTRKNSNKIKPWISLVSIIAKQIMINRQQ